MIAAAGPSLKIHWLRIGDSTCSVLARVQASLRGSIKTLSVWSPIFMSKKMCRTFQNIEWSVIERDHRQLGTVDVDQHKKG
jgi:hypothetical protein